MFVEVGKSKISVPFDSILQLLLSKGEHLAFVPDSSETSMMVNILSLKFPLLKVPGQFGCHLFQFLYKFIQNLEFNFSFMVMLIWKIDLRAANISFSSLLFCIDIFHPCLGGCKNL